MPLVPDAESVPLAAPERLQLARDRVEAGDVVQLADGTWMRIFCAYYGLGPDTIFKLDNGKDGDAPLDDFVPPPGKVEVLRFHDAHLVPGSADHVYIGEWVQEPGTGRIHQVEPAEPGEPPAPATVSLRVYRKDRDAFRLAAAALRAVPPASAA